MVALHGTFACSCEWQGAGTHCQVSYRHVQVYQFGCSRFGDSPCAVASVEASCHNCQSSCCKAVAKAEVLKACHLALCARGRCPCCLCAGVLPQHAHLQAQCVCWRQVGTLLGTLRTTRPNAPARSGPSTIYGMEGLRVLPLACCPNLPLAVRLPAVLAV